MRSRAFTILIALLMCSVDACGRTELPVSYRAECGDGIVDPAKEACDDGNQIDSDACVFACNRARCGDGFVQTDVEACDDGNTDPLDGCLSNCALPTCGNGIIEPGEVCDDGNASDRDNCPSRCLPAICGDGFVHSGVEECDGGSFNTNSPAFLLIQGSLVRPVSPIARPQPVASFYDYRSASAHTEFEQTLTSQFFLYHDSNNGGMLGLVTLHGIDKQTSGEEQPTSNVEQSFSGLPNGSFIAVEDDTKNEFRLIEASKAQGDWHFKNNTDGGALSGFPYPGAFVIEIVSNFIDGVERWQYIDGDGTLIALEKDVPAKLIALDTSAACRLDCTIPRCGDGILDGGEICDDGNTIAGDGCGANCR